MTINTLSEVIIVLQEIIETLIQLKRLLILYEGVSKNEEYIIQLLTTIIEQISEEGKGNLFIETLISEYNYPRYFDQEEVKESFDVEPFFRFPITIGV
jgi:hypothetical protein